MCSKGMITSEQITKLAARKNVRANAVKNFLGSVGDLTYQEAVGNVEMDAQSYGWNHETVAAIREGLLTHFFKS